MNLTQFFEELQGVKEAGFVAFFYGKTHQIRLRPPGVGRGELPIYSPTTVVCLLRKGESFYIADADWAAHVLELSKDDADLLRRAEDEDYWQAQVAQQVIHKTRHALLATLHLRERK